MNITLTLFSDHLTTPVASFMGFFTLQSQLKVAGIETPALTYDENGQEMLFTGWAACTVPPAAEFFSPVLSGAYASLCVPVQ